MLFTILAKCSLVHSRRTRKFRHRYWPVGDSERRPKKGGQLVIHIETSQLPEPSGHARRLHTGERKAEDARQVQTRRRHDLLHPLRSKTRERPEIRDTINEYANPTGMRELLSEQAKSLQLRRRRGRRNSHEHREADMFAKYLLALVYRTHEPQRSYVLERERE